ncbi:MAG: Z1 domain-containing protein [Sulfuricaulis sp.]
MPGTTFDQARFLNVELNKGQYRRQLKRLADEGKQVDCIEAAVDGAVRNLSGTEKASFVIYGEPQSGKTEMMICLTARLLDEGRQFILHLLNDSVDLLGQNLGRFQKSGLAPAAKNYTDVLDPSIQIKGRTHVVFCKKNARDLEKLFGKIGKLKDIVVIDDEADYASPNAKVNQNTRTRINKLITDLLGSAGDYIGVTATPARLDLNNTFDNDSRLWVSFPTHRLYTGQDTFFPQNPNNGLGYELSLLPPNYDAPKYARTAFFGFIVNVAYLNTREGVAEQNYSMLIHTSGKRVDHKADWDVFDQTIASLIDHSSTNFPRYLKEVWDLALKRYGDAEADKLTHYVLANITRYAIFILNSDRDFVQNGLSATNPSALFTIIIGGNIVSRGVTFENLLAMFFTRDVKHKLQQDTYIQRARMFGARGKYLPQFELTIPDNLYLDWTRCFVFHRLALSAIQRELGAPVWLTDNRIAAVSNASIDRSTVDVNRGEMAFHLFDYTDEYDVIVKSGESVLMRLERLSALLGNEVFPGFLKEFMITASSSPSDMIAIHPSSSIDGYSDGEPGLDKARIERRKGLIGTNQLEKNRYPKAVHHLKVFTNAAGKGRLFYKYEGSIQFIKNLKK